MGPFQTSSFPNWRLHCDEHPNSPLDMQLDLDGDEYSDGELRKACALILIEDHNETEHTVDIDGLLLECVAKDVF